MLLSAYSKEVYRVFRSMLAPVHDAQIAYAATSVFFFACSGIQLELLLPISERKKGTHTSYLAYADN